MPPLEGGCKAAPGEISWASRYARKSANARLLHEVSAASETPDRQPGLSCAAMKLRGQGGFLRPEIGRVSVFMDNRDCDGRLLRCRARGGERTRPRVLFPAPPPEMFCVHWERSPGKSLRTQQTACRSPSCIPTCLISITLASRSRPQIEMAKEWGQGNEVQLLTFETIPLPPFPCQQRSRHAHTPFCSWLALRDADVRDCELAGAVVVAMDGGGNNQTGGASGDFLLVRHLDAAELPNRQRRVPGD